ncbi:MAG TPA: hypothetical protein VK427_17050 [Kofleriaceae bacterium]|nr:hypothetical protein [Kofleriaceae bacterium]
MATPPYQGLGQQPADNGGLFGRFGSFFGGSTPSYAGVGQPSSASSGSFGGSAVAYAPAPPAPVVPKPETSSTSSSQSCSENDDEAYAEMTCPIDPEALASGHIAIVIPRERLGPCIEKP